LLSFSTSSAGISKCITVWSTITATKSSTKSRPNKFLK
jgi:hypothetical protein